MISAVQGARYFYWGLHIVINFYFFYYNTELKKQILGLKLLVPIVYVLCFVLATYLIYDVGKRPGYLKFAIQQEIKLERTGESDNYEILASENNHIVLWKEKYHPFGNLRSPKPHHLREEEDLAPSERLEMISLNKEEDSLNSTFESIDDKEQDLGEVEDEEGKYNNDNDIYSEEDFGDNPPLHYCDKCQIYQPYRTKHCNECQACVTKFDHHCFWLGGCVGELNHCKFWWMLLFMTLEYIIALYYVNYFNLLTLSIGVYRIQHNY